jgi:hypothetical protein
MNSQGANSLPVAKHAARQKAVFVAIRNLASACF